MRWCAVCLLFALALGPSVPSPAVATGPAPALELAFATDDLTAAARLPVGSELRLRAVPLDPERDLALHRIRVFSPDARVLVQTPGGERRLPISRTVYYGGRIAGEPGSRAFLAIRTTGEIRGLISGAGRWWLLGKRPGDAAAWLVEAQPATAPTGGFQCLAEDMDASRRLASAGVPPPDAPWTGTSVTTPSSAGTLPSYTARVAFETDEEFLALFGGDTAAAVDYVGDLIAYGSTLYEAEVDTNLLVSSVNLWQAADPWGQSSVSCRLYEFGRHWNDNHGGIDRTVAHFLSGRPANAGIAWVGVLCGGGFVTNISGAGCSLSPGVDNYGGAYGYSSGLDVTFDPENPQVVWDFVVTAHEIGHNFNSPHTHCYGGIGGNPDAVDECYNAETACYGGPTSLPCSGKSGCGTLMSYCHLRPGGLDNIAPTLGLGHPYGVEPDRVPARMLEHVVSRAAQHPGCLDPVLPQELVFDPAVLDFGGVDVGSTSAPRDATLQNTGSTPATDLIFSTPGNGFEAATDDCPDILGVGESCVVAVTFTPPTEGLSEAVLQAGSGEGASALLALAGNGVPGLSPTALVVDPRGLDSNGNGVFEPGESVEMAPSWQNDGGDPELAEGTVSSFTGPAGASYDILSDSVDYVIPAGESDGCLDAEGGCYELRIEVDGSHRPTAHWDATVDEELTTDPGETFVQPWTLHVGDSFTDVSPTHLFYSSIETLLHSGVTGGCTDSRYCPASANSRSQMPIFVLKAVEGADYEPQACVEGGEEFDDVPFDNPFCPWIEELAERGIVSGCGGGDYCPTDAVTRAQMAIFLLKSLEGGDYTPPTCSGAFDDVPCPSLFADWIEELAAREITGGCSATGYCPGDPVSRAQMAVFVTKTFGLTLYGP